MVIPAPLRRMQRACFAVFASLAMVAQLAVALAPLGEGMEPRRGAHVEAAGLVQHFSHSETTCASCQARSILGNASNPGVPLFRDATVASAPRHRGVEVVFTETLSKDSPRAPPA